MTSSNNTRFELFGSLTSPFVRRVRIVALERGVPFELVDVNAAADGWARLKAASPVWKMPAARFSDGTVAWESRVIVNALCRDGWAPLRAPPTSLAESVDEENVVSAVDEALLALVRCFYIKRDGGSLDVAFFQKDRARAERILAWLDQRVRNGRFIGAHGAGQGFGYAEIATLTATGWMRFRKMADIAAYKNLDALEKAWTAERASVSSTAPQG